MIGAYKFVEQVSFLLSQIEKLVMIFLLLLNTTCFIFHLDTRENNEK